MRGFSMGRVIVNIFLLMVYLVLTSCTPYVRSEKLVPDQGKIESINIVIYMGDLSSIAGIGTSSIDTYRTKFRKGLMERFPAIFTKNGILVKDHSVESGEPVNYKKAMDTNNGSSHTLFLFSEALSGYGVQFDVELWDNITKKKIWKSDTPTLALVENQPMHRSELLARDVLIGLNRNSLIQLKNDTAINMSGQPISPMFTWSDDK